MPLNRFNQLIGPAVEDEPAILPSISILNGRYGNVEHIQVDRHFADIADYYTNLGHPADWTYLYDDPFPSREAVKTRLHEYELSQNPYMMAITDLNGHVVGTFGLLNINPEWRTAEMGRVIYFPELRHTRLATEAQYLVMKYVFEKMHYRRYE